MSSTLDFAVIYGLTQPSKSEIFFAQILTGILEK